jgi:hypothetical protein
MLNIFATLLSMSDSAEPKTSDSIKVRRRPLGLFLLPFLYFYFLSFTLLGLSAYILVKNPIGTKSSFASDITNPGTDDIKITLVKETQKSTENENEFAFECRRDVADKIDAFFGQWDLPLTGNGCDFDLHGQENNVDPVFVASIAFIESTGGKVTPKFGGKESYNPFGWAVYDSNEITKDVDGYSCDSFEHCIGRVTRGIKRNSDKRDLKPIPADVVTWYNPGSIVRAGGVLENSSWYKNVTKTMDKINAMVPSIKEETTASL